MNVPTQPRKLVKVNQIKEYFKISAHFQTYVRVTQPSRKIAAVISSIMVKLEIAKNSICKQYFFFHLNSTWQCFAQSICTLIFFRVRTLKNVKLYPLKKNYGRNQIFFSELKAWHPIFFQVPALKLLKVNANMIFGQ